MECGGQYHPTLTEHSNSILQFVQDTTRSTHLTPCITIQLFLGRHLCLLMINWCLVLCKYILVMGVETLYVWTCRISHPLLMMWLLATKSISTTGIQCLTQSKENTYYHIMWRCITLKHSAFQDVEDS